MEEVFRAEVLQVLVDPVQQAFVALGNSRSDGVGVAQLLNADNVFGASLVGEGDNLGVVICPNSIGVVFECGLSCSVGVVLLELEVLVVLGEVGLGSGAGDYDYRAVANLVEVGNNLVLVGNNAQGNVHVRIGEVDCLSALGGDGEVCQDNVNLASLQVFNAVGCFGGYQLNIYSKVLAKAVCQLDVVALVVAVFIDVAEGALVTEYADGDLAAVLDLVKDAVICARGIAIAGAARE